MGYEVPGDSHIRQLGGPMHWGLHPTWTIPSVPHHPLPDTDLPVTMHAPQLPHPLIGKGYSGWEPEGRLYCWQGW